MQIRSIAHKLSLIFSLEGVKGLIQPWNFIPVSSEEQKARKPPSLKLWDLRQKVPGKNWFHNSAGAGATTDLCLSECGVRAGESVPTVHEGLWGCVHSAAPIQPVPSKVYATAQLQSSLPFPKQPIDPIVSILLMAAWIICES